jgi:hypothetical protein
MFVQAIVTVYANLQVKEVAQLHGNKKKASGNNPGKGRRKPLFFVFGATGDKFS